jgi:hypothetical protein
MQGFMASSFSVVNIFGDVTVEPKNNNHNFLAVSDPA